jgi:protoporphyrinogen/coproporphyrinogen III oxidase
MPIDGTTIAVVGSGASGLGAAYELYRSGFEVDVLERNDRPGGRFGPTVLGDRPVMTGGKNIGHKYTEFRKFVAAMGTVQWEPFGYNSSRLRGESFVTFDSSKRLKTLANIAKLGAPRDLLLFASIGLKVRSDEANRFLGSELSAGLSKKYDYAPVTDHFSRKFAAALLRPLILRQTGAEPSEAYMGTLPTNVASMMDSYDQMVPSIQPVLDAFFTRVHLQPKTSVQGVVVADGEVRGLQLSIDGGPTTEKRYAGVVLATPAFEAATIVGGILPSLTKRLSEIRYYPSTVALVEYDRPVFSEEVRALAIDDGPCSNIGTYGKDDRHIVRYTFSGRDARDLDTSDDTKIDRWLDRAEQRASKYLPFGGASRVRTLVQHWPAAYCGYTPYHSRWLQGVNASLSEVQGLQLAGDYIKGTFIESCFRSGASAAQRLAAGLPKPSTMAGAEPPP